MAGSGSPFLLEIHMSTRRQPKAQGSIADQLQPVKDALAQGGHSANDHQADAAELVFPTLLSVEEIHVPGDAPSPATEMTPLQLRSNNAHWVEFEQLIERGEYAAAATVVDFLDSDAELKASLTGLYVKAQIVIKRGQIEFAQAQSTAEKAAEEKTQAAAQLVVQRQAEQRQQEARQLQAARQRSLAYWLGRGVAAMKQNPNVAGPGFAAVALLVLSKLGS